MQPVLLVQQVPLEEAVPDERLAKTKQPMVVLLLVVPLDLQLEQLALLVVSGIHQVGACKDPFCNPQSLCALASSLNRRWAACDNVHANATLTCPIHKADCCRGLHAKMRRKMKHKRVNQLVVERLQLLLCEQFLCQELILENDCEQHNEKNLDNVQSKYPM